MNFNFIQSNLSTVTSSFTVKPLDYPRISSHKFISADVINGSSSIALIDGRYQVQIKTSLSANDFYINIISGSASLISGSDYSHYALVIHDWINSDSSNCVNQTITLTPFESNRTYNGDFVVKDRIILTTDSSGMASGSLINGYYNVEIEGVTKDTPTIIFVSGSGTLYATDLEVQSSKVSKVITPQNQTAYGYTAQVSDAKYVTGVNGTASYAITASFAMNGGNGGGASLTTGSTYPITSSWATKSVSASYSPSQLPDITDDTTNHRIGINKTNPAYALDIDGQIGRSIGNLIIQPNTYNVGISTPLPSHKLDVNGDINFTTNLLRNGGIYVPDNANTASSLNSYNDYQVQNFIASAIQCQNDLYVDLAGSTTDSPRILGLNNSNDGNAARFQFGDAYNSISNNYGGKQIWQGYWGIEIHGSRQTTGAPVSFIAGQTTDPNLNIVNDYDVVALNIMGVSGQTQPLTQWQTFNGNNLASVTSNGEIHLNGSLVNDYDLSFQISNNGQNSWVQGLGGYFGINTSEPAVNLDVNGIVGNSHAHDFNSQCYWGDLLVAEGIFSGDLGAFYLTGQAGGSSWVNGAGGGTTFGVGTTSPAYTLDVAGNVNFTGNLTNNGNAYVPKNATSSSYTSGSVVASLMQLPYSSSGHPLTITPLATGSAYFQTTSTSNLLFIYNGTRWTSASLA